MKNIKFDNKDKLYKFINIKLTGLICVEKDWLANICNASALLWQLLDDINWVGFYLYKNEELVLGPFQGKVACTHIQLGKGVCGTAAKELSTQLVKNVHDFEGHIACDSASNSEIVIPIIQQGKLIGLLDIDSPIINRFDEEDKKGLEKFVNNIVKFIIFPEKFV